MNVALRSLYNGAQGLKFTVALNTTGKRYIRRFVSPFLEEVHRRKKKINYEKFYMEEKVKDPRCNYLEWNYDAEVYAFNQRLTEKFDVELLAQALTHRSHVIVEEQKLKKVGIEEPNLEIQDNREMIEKGREFTSKIIETYLGKCLWRAPEEVIISLHDHLMSTSVLANSSSLIGTPDIILTEEYPPSEETLANTFLALVAALAESVDEIHASKFVRDFLIATLAIKDLPEIYSPEEPLKILNKVLKNEGRGPAEPRIINQTGVNSVLPVYNVGIFADKQLLSTGCEDNVDGAVHIAALNALYSMFGINESARPIKFDLTVDPSADKMKNLPIHQWCTKNAMKLMNKNV